MTKRLAIVLTTTELDRLSRLARLRESTPETLAVESIARALDIIRGGGAFMPPDKIDFKDVPVLPEPGEGAVTSWQSRKGIPDPVVAVLQSKRPVAEAEHQAAAIFAQYEPGSCYNQPARYLAAAVFLYTAFDPDFSGDRTLLAARQRVWLTPNDTLQYLETLGGSDIFGGYVSTRAEQLLSQSMRTRGAEPIHLFMWAACDIFFEKPDGRQHAESSGRNLIVRLPDDIFTELMIAAFKRKTSPAAFARCALAPLIAAKRPHLRMVKPAE